MSVLYQSKSRHKNGIIRVTVVEVSPDRVEIQRLFSYDDGTENKYTQETNYQGALWMIRALKRFEKLKNETIHN